MKVQEDCSRAKGSVLNTKVKLQEAKSPMASARQGLRLHPKSNRPRLQGSEQVEWNDRTGLTGGFPLNWKLPGGGAHGRLIRSYILGTYKGSWHLAAP